MFQTTVRVVFYSRFQIWLFYICTRTLYIIPGGCFLQEDVAILYIFSGQETHLKIVCYAVEDVTVAGILNVYR